MRGSSERWEGGELGGGEVHRVQGGQAPGEGRGRSEEGGRYKIQDTRYKGQKKKKQDK